MLFELGVFGANLAVSIYSFARNFSGGSGSEAGALNALVATAASPAVMTAAFVFATGSSVGMPWEAAAAASLVGSYAGPWVVCVNM
jgi:hypothetical protein